MYPLNSLGDNCCLFEHDAFRLMPNPQCQGPFVVHVVWPLPCNQFGMVKPAGILPNSVVYHPLFSIGPAWRSNTSQSLLSSTWLQIKASHYPTGCCVVISACETAICVCRLQVTSLGGAVRSSAERVCERPGMCWWKSQLNVRFLQPQQSCWGPPATILRTHARTHTRMHARMHNAPQPLPLPQPHTHINVRKCFACFRFSFWNQILAFLLSKRGEKSCWQSQKLLIT